MPDLAYATAGPGDLFNAIGWFDFSSLPSTITVPYVATLVNTMKGGGTMQATFTITNDGGLTTTTFIRMAPPTWSGAAFGNTAYLGITAPVCLRENSTLHKPNYGRVVVSDIILKNKYGQQITNYNLYFLDSETVDGTDPETFTTNGGAWTSFFTMANPSGSSTTTLNGLGTQTVTTSGTGNTPIITTANPTSLTMTLAGQAALTLGMSLTMAEIRKVVNDRINPSDQFVLTISGPNNGTTTTAGLSTGVQAQGIQVISGVSGLFTFNETMSASSVTTLSLYNPALQVSNLTNGGTALPSTIPLGGGLTLNNGDYALVTITNAPAATSVTLNKTVDKQYTDLLQTLTYTLAVNNKSAYPIRNVVVKDTIPIGSTIIANSLTLDGVSVGGSITPPNGLSLGTLAAGALSTITFKVLVNSTLPSPNNIINNATTTFDPTISIGSINSQTVITTINRAIISSSKLTSKNYADVGDTITYTIVLRNVGSTTANNVLFVDTLPTGTSLVTNSFKQDATNITGSPGLVTLPNNIAGYSTSTVTFQVVVNTIPTPSTISNTASTGYAYSVIPTIPNTVNSSTVTNTVVTKINNADLDGISKSVNTAYSKCGDTLTYTITIPNNGNVTATNVVYKDTLPNGVTFVTNSVKVNGVTVPGASPVPPTGVTVGTIASGASATVVFDVIVTC